MLVFRTTWFVLSFLLSFHTLFGQQTKYSIAYLGPDDGLSQLEVQCFLQDRRSMLWMGTKDGLNLYNGYTFTIFRNNPSDPHSLPNNHIKALYEDRQGMIWIGTLGGLSMYNPELKKFYNFQHLPDDSNSLVHFDVNDIFEDSRDNIWIGAGIGISRLIRKGINPADWSFKRYNQFSSFEEAAPDKLIGTTCRSIKEDSLGRIWMGFYKNVRGNLGLNTGAISYFDYKDSTFHHFTDWNWEGKEGSDYEIETFLKTRNGDLWAGTINQGLKKLSLDVSTDSLSLRTYNHDPTDKQGLPHRFVKALLEDRKGNIWIGTFAGLAKMENTIGGYAKPRFYPLNKPGEKELKNPNIHSLFEDNGGIIWIGTEVGLFYMIPTQKAFKNYRQETETEKGLMGNMTFGITEAENGDIWAANYGLGLTRIISHSDGSEDFLHYGKKEGLVDPSVIHISTGNDGHLWASTFGGVNEIIYEQSKPRFIKYMALPGSTQSIKTPYVYEVFQDKKENIWMANFTGGLDRIVKKPTGIQFSNYMRDKENLFSLPTNRLRRIQGDRMGRVWAITGGASLLYEGKDSSLRFRHIFVDPSDHLKPLGEGISDVYLDEYGIYWMGGEKGFYRVELLDAEKSPWEEGTSHLLAADIKYYGIQEGLANSHIISILPDDKGNLWLSTHLGLSKFNPATESFRNYDKEDGLQGNEFNGLSGLRTKAGELLFGGTNGITRFHPDSIRDSKYVASAVLTSFNLFNEEVIPGKEFEKTGFLLDRSISHMDHIQLSYKELVISFEFTSPDYARPKNITYKYQLEGFEENWVDAGSRRFATYTNLDPGEYTFKVIAANADGVWQKNPTKIRISMSPPPWKSWWALCLYTLAILFLLYSIFMARARSIRREMKIKARIEQAKVEEREEVRAESSRDFHDEAGNRLSKISLYTGLSKRKVTDDDELLNYLGKIEDHIKELSGGMRDFIWVLDPKHDKLQDIVLRIQDFGKSMFEDTGIDFQVSSTLDQVLNPRVEVASKRHILLIFKEAMHNILKYASCNAVMLDFNYKDGVFTTKLSDNGLGFEEDELKRINGLNNMKERAEEIGGILSINSVPGIGTQIELQIEIHPNG